MPRPSSIPQDVYDVARMAFLEMLLSGTTTVGEFHYLHNAPGGRPYDDPNLLSKQIIAAAQSVGIRIVLLRSAYLRSGYELPPDPGQIRFYETARQFIDNMEALAAATSVQIGVAPHSLRAVPWVSSKKLLHGRGFASCLSICTSQNRSRRMRLAYASMV